MLIGTHLDARAAVIPHAGSDDAVIAAFYEQVKNDSLHDQLQAIMSGTKSDTISSNFFSHF